jgi:serpin B
MTFVLPDRPDGLRALEAKLDGPTFVRWVGALAPQPIACAIPEFDIAPVEPMPLTTMLEGLGMRLAFDRDRADFSGIAPAPDPGQRLYLGAVLHAAAVTVDEAGTRATAATAVSAPSGAPVLGEKRRPFVADHPFAFFIRDVASGAVLFAGRVVRPGEP